MRTLSSLTGNSQKLDGGAMFGNAPKALWQRWMPADEDNRIDLGCRALLVQEPGRNILIETGIGAFFSPQMKQRYGVQESRHVLLDSLAELGLSDADIAAALPAAGDELERCRALWQKKFGSPAQTPAERAKQLRFLQYRGFSHTAISAVLRYGEEA